MCEDNINEVTQFAQRFKYEFPNKEIWLYTGFNFKDVLFWDNKFKLLQLCDYIKCGTYEEDLKCIDNIQYDIRIATSNQQIYKKGLDY